MNHYDTTLSLFNVGVKHSLKFNGLKTSTLPVPPYSQVQIRIVLFQPSVSSPSAPLLDQHYYSHLMVIDKSLHFPILPHPVQIFLQRWDAMSQTNLATLICAPWLRRWLPYYIRIQYPDIKILRICEGNHRLGSRYRIMTERTQYRK